MAELEAEQRRRLISLRETCAKYSIGEGGHQVSNGEEIVEEVEEMKSWLLRQSVPKKPLWQNLICSKEHKVSICPVYKAASTFLLKKFLLIAPSRSYDRWVAILFHPGIFTFFFAQGVGETPGSAGKCACQERIWLPRIMDKISQFYHKW